MRLEYLAEGVLVCPLIRLTHFSAAEASSLASAIASLAAGEADRVAVHEIPGVVAVGRSELVFRCRAWDQAVVRVGPSSFECGWTSGTWDNVAGLVEPFTSGAGGYQWLAGAPGEVSLLLSASGDW